MADLSQFKVGDNIYVQGTGNWWSGIYKAQVADIRDSDNTIKIRYQDGGFKRFSKDQLAQHLVKYDDPVLEKFGTKAYELDFESYDIQAFEDPLQLQLTESIQKRDFKKAQQIKEKIDQKRNAIKDINSLNMQIQQAIYKQDFKLADDLQYQIKALDKILKDTEIKAQKELAGGQDFNWGELLKKTFYRALGGGFAGASAMAIQVLTLMWMRTTMNYQYRYGTSTREALKALYAQGGIPRFYKGLIPALLQGPLSRFGDTFSNTGAMAFLNSNPKTKDLNTSLKTLVSSFCAASFRIVLMPIDTVKTIMQVEGKDGLAKLGTKFRNQGPTVFYNGAIGASVATFAGHYPWFFTYNMLDANLPKQTILLYKLARSAFIGFCSSAISDTVSNSIRVLKTYKQTAQEKLTYAQIAQKVIKEDGLIGLFGRGLQTRIIANGIQGCMFSVLWKYFDERLQKRSQAKNA